MSFLLLIRLMCLRFVLRWLLCVMRVIVILFIMFLLMRWFRVWVVLLRFSMMLFGFGRFGIV